MWCKAVVFAVLALYLHQGEAVKCYTCTSATDAKCADPIDSSIGMSECTPNIFKEGTSMLKDAADAVSGLLGKIGIDSNLEVPQADASFACVKAVKQDGDKKVVIRSCSVPTTEKFNICSQLKASGGVVTFCETCNTDGCNAASGVVPSSLLMMLVVAVAAYFTKQ